MTYDFDGEAKTLAWTIYRSTKAQQDAIERALRAVYVAGMRDARRHADDCSSDRISEVADRIEKE